MNKDEYRVLTEDRKPLGVSVDELKDKTPRTLIYGYTAERHTFHTYLEGDEIHVVVYGFENDLIYYRTSASGLTHEDCVPRKRIYPEACDYEFCEILKSRGVYLPFTTWTEGRIPEQFYGACLEDLV